MELDLLRQICKLCGAPSRENWPGCEGLPWYEPMMRHLKNLSENCKVENGESVDNGDVAKPLCERYRRCILIEPFLKYHLTEEALRFVDYLLVLDPEQRPTAQEVLSARYLKS